MKKLRWIGAFTLILFVAAILSVVKIVSAQDSEPQTITVTITPNSNPHKPPSVDPDSVDVYRSKNQQVEWTCSTGCDFTVDFPKSHGKPFSGGTFTKANPKSGVPTGPPGAYPYHGEGGQRVNGPHDYCPLTRA